MLTKGTLVHFKSWENIQAIRFAPITGLFGTNSSGKTSILQWLLMLKQTVESSDRGQVLNLGTNRDPVELGGFRDIVYGHAKPGELSWKLTWKLPKMMKVLDPADRRGILFEGDSLTFSCNIRGELIGDETIRMKVIEMAYEVAGWQFIYLAKDGKSGYKLDVTGGHKFKLTRIPGRVWDLPEPVKCYGFPDQVNSYFQNAGFLPDFQLAFEQLFTDTYYLGPLREDPQRHYTWSGAQPADVGRRGENAVHAILASRGGKKIGRGKGKDKFTVEQYAAHWLKELGLIHDFHIERVSSDSNLYQVRVRKTQEAAEVLITDVGFGISQILPVLVLCYYVREGSTIILEQPEIHLHPAVQAGLADVFIDAIKVRGVQIILESHSEHLLRCLQRRMAEEELPQEQIALYFCEYSKGRSDLTPLQVDTLGNILNWPIDFFGDEMGEMAAMARAQMKRKLRKGA